VELTGKPVARFLSEMTGEPIPRGGVKKADKVEIAAPSKPPRAPRPPARKAAPARPTPHKGADGPYSARKPTDAANTVPPRRGRAGPDSAPRKDNAGTPRPPATRGNTPRGPRK